MRRALRARIPATSGRELTPLGRLRKNLKVVALLASAMLGFGVLAYLASPLFGPEAADRAVNVILISLAVLAGDAVLLLLASFAEGPGRP